MNRRAILYALLSAALFGASTPLAKALVREVTPLMLAGLLYLGSGLGLALWRALARTKGEAAAPVAKQDLPWLAAAIACGGVAGPALLMYGLQLTDGSTASLLLNLEAVFTALLAWVVFRENVDRRVFLGMAAIVAGGAILSAGQLSASSGALFIGGACLCWALDNNLTRHVSGGDPVVLAALKGLVAGPVNLALAYSQGAHLPALPIAGAVLVLGLAGYGISLVFFILALRGLGTARTGAYFSVAPFFGAALALLLLGEQPGAAFWAAAGLMALGVWLHISERHEHEHVHEPLLHEHEHTHDQHHRHEHAFWDGREPHTHAHRHEALGHRHPHYPDLHHRHGH